MDAERYAKVRELFLGAEELPVDQQLSFVRLHGGNDQGLIDEVLSLLVEHDADSAQMEGNRKSPLVLPSDSNASAMMPSQDTASGDQPKKFQGNKSNDATLVGSQRTHASPRSVGGETIVDVSLSKTNLWEKQQRRMQRRNSWWLLLAAMLPTLVVGWLTYRRVSQMLQEAVRSEVQGMADGLMLSTKRFLDNEAQLVQSWSRQKQIRDAIVALDQIARTDQPKEALRAATESDDIMSQLQYLSGNENIKFVVWDRTGNTLASWLPDRADVGNSIVDTQANGLARVFRGETIIFGPERLRNNTEGFVPETDLPVMAPIVPVRNDGGRVVAALLVRGFKMFNAFDQVFGDSSRTANLDAYAVNQNAIMVTNSPRAIRASKTGHLEVEEQDIAALIRITDPGDLIQVSSFQDINRQIMPLTFAAARVSRGQDGMQMTPYRNYSGELVVGAWRWLDSWHMGVVVERNAEDAFAAARIVRLGFLTLAGLLAMTALAAASRIARRSSQANALLHPLSRYDIIRELGSGGMGVVYLAKHRQLGRNTALKVLRDDRRTRDDQSRFNREARLAATLSSPHSVKIYDYGNNLDGESYCVMEYLTGLTLAEVVARSGYQSLGRTLYLLRQVCDAICEAHSKGLMHRDLKPHNVMLTRDATAGDWAVVFDFGLAKPVSPTKDIFNTVETIWSGTPMYMAPERYREPERMDPRSDIYSIGCVAYFLITGHPPFAECDPESMFALIMNETPIQMMTHRNEEVPDDLVRFVKKCMAKELDQRYQSIDKVIAELDRLRFFHPWTPENAEVWWQVHGSDLITNSGDSKFG